ncbi:LysE family translocator [Azospirillum agricola]|uniref:LysE family translocator n=1 Tax=Azospirillum agricola TaxID=1720247 RepID=UPI000A0F1464|nr:LysE family translocator [Azospirillum agricola]SMH56979.1 Threonine/homoserine/homoserine lactone efflux protein [Azospirillum lipoferum]
MLAYDAAHWSAFLAAAVLLNLSPGPDMAFILGHTVKGGVRAGTAAMLGIWTGAFGHVLLAALGLSAVVASSALAFSAVKWAGVAYLLWIGAQALRSRGGAFLPEDGAPSSGGAWAVYRQGVLIDLLNPKVAVFFLAFLPQFVAEGAGPVWLQLLVHGVLIIAVAAVVEPPLVLLGDRLTRRLRSSRRLGLWLDRTLGALLVGLGLRLALTER